MPDRLKTVILPLLTLIDVITEQILAFDKEIDQLADSKYPESFALCQIHGVGALTSLTFVLTLEDKHRFRKSRDAGCFLGLQLRRSQSGRSIRNLGSPKPATAICEHCWSSARITSWGPSVHPARCNSGDGNSPSGVGRMDDAGQLSLWQGS